MEKLTEITFQRWIKWAKIIDSDLKQIIYKYDVHRQFIDVVNANIDHINQNNGSTYINFVSFCYYDSLFSGIRRHAKYKRKEGVSLLRLIDNIYKSSNQFTFDYYLEQYPYKYNIPHWQKDVFSSFSSGGDTIDNNVIDNDLSKLEHISKNITNFVDTHVAHLDPSSKLNPVSIKRCKRCY